MSLYRTDSETSVSQIVIALVFVCDDSRQKDQSCPHYVQYQILIRMDLAFENVNYIFQPHVNAKF